MPVVVPDEEWWEERNVFMNGAHDLGGMHGLGPICAEPESEEPVFHHDWEQSVFAMTLAVGALGKWNLDQSRQARERQHPIDYLRHSYYENWLVGLETLLVESGLVTPEELMTGRASRPVDDETRAHVLKADQVLTRLSKSSVVTEVATPPRFKPGDRVRAVNRHPTGHTRAPRYTRGRVGVVHAYHHAHVFPDLSAQGLTEGRHLYSIRFAAAELWGDSAVGWSAIYVDMWEDYLEPVL